MVRYKALLMFLNIRIVEHTIALSQQFAAAIGSWEGPTNPAMLQIDRGQIMGDHPGTLGMEIYATTCGVLHFITAPERASLRNSQSAEPKGLGLTFVMTLPGRG
jgi:hypothetical protein